ncbi:MAG: T9SS type A sorting domain-containing protein [Bacteroidota bacterium]
MKQISLILISLFFGQKSLIAQVDWLTQTEEFYNGTNFEGRAIGNSLASDGLNNVYVVGEYDGLTTFDTISIADGDGPLYLAKYDDNGDIQWVNPIDGNSNNKTSSVVVDGNGNAIILGEYRHTNANTILNFGTLSLTGNIRFSGFIAKCDPDGNWVWANRMLASTGSGSFVNPVDMVTMPGGDVIVIGHLENPVEIDGQLYNQTNDREGVFMARFDTDGNLLWFKNNESGGPFSNISVARIEVGSAGQVYVNGSFSGEPIWGTDTLRAPESGDHFIARFDGNGDLEWYRTQRSRGNDQHPTQFGVDAQDNVYFTFRKGGGDLLLDDVTLSGASFPGRFLLLKYNAQGDRVLMKSFARTSGQGVATGIFDESLLVHSASNGQLFISGEYGAGTLQDYMVFGDQDSFLMPNTFIEEATHFVLSLDSEGNHLDVGFIIDQYLASFTTGPSFKPTEICLNAAGKLLMTGEFEGIYEMGTDSLNTSILDQMFLLQMDPDVLFDITTGIEANDLTASAQVYPNPSRHWLHIKLNAFPNTEFDYQLMQLDGRVVQRGQSMGQIAVHDLPAGMYSLQINVSGRSFSRKVVIVD